MKIQFLGHSAFYLEEGRFKALTDPFLDDSPICNISSEEFKELTHIFLTHGHFDHIGDAVKLSERTGALIISNKEICEHLNLFGVKTQIISIGETIEFEYGTVKMVAAAHPSEITHGEEMKDGGDASGFIFNINGTKIYHPGDTTLMEEMKDYKIENIDVALLPIGGTYTMDIVEASKAIEYIDPKVVIPMHYNTFPVIEADPYEFKKNSEKIIVLNIGEIYEI